MRIRHSWFVAALSVGFVVSGCSKDGGSSGGATSSEDLSLLPADSEVVLGINFSQIQSSSLYKEFAPKLMEKVSKELGDVKAACGFDPFDSVKSISVGLKDVGGESTSGVFVIHGIEKSKLMAKSCLDKLNESSKDKSPMTVEDGVMVEHPSHGPSIAVGFTNDTTMVGVIGADANKDSIKKVAAANSGLKTSSAFSEVFGKIKSDQSLWVVINAEAPAFSQLGQLGMHPKRIFGSLNVTDGLGLDLRVRMSSADEATQLTTMAKGQIGSPMVKAMFDKLDVTSDGAEVHVDVAMTEAQLKSIAAMAKGGLGGLMGGGGGM